MVDVLRARLPAIAWWGALGGLLVLVVVDALGGYRLNGVFAGAAVLASVAAGPRRTTITAALAVLCSLASGLWASSLVESGWLMRFVGCLVICMLAVAGARVRQGQQRHLERTTVMAQQMLDALAVELTGARTVKDVADGFVQHMVTTAGAMSAMVMRRDPDDVLRTVVWHGRGPSALESYTEVPLSSSLPGAVSVREDLDLHFWSRDEIEHQLPFLKGYYPSDRSLHLMPLRRGAVPSGLLVLTFPAGAFRRRDQTFLHSLARALSSAMLRGEEIQRYDAEVHRHTLLAEASLRLSRSLDPTETAEEIGRLMVPRFADWCSLQVLEGEQLVTLLVQHRDPETTEWARSMLDVFPTNMDSPTGAPQVVRTGRSEIYPYIPTQLVQEAAINEEHAEILLRLGFTSAITAPLRGRGAVLGALTLIHSDSGRTYTDADLAFLEEIADRAALALETATTFEEQSTRLADVTQVAQAAQLAILAPPPEHIAPVSLSARYVSAAAAAQVGGDLYEVIAVPHGVRMLIGDVRGKGLTAVRTATVVLGAFRAAAAAVGDLAEVAVEIDRRIKPFLLDAEEFVTAALLDIHHDGRTDLIACGHPPPYLIPAEGTPRTLDVVPSPPLGLGVEPVVGHHQLCPGDRVLLYTDGLVEARTDSGAFVDPLPIVGEVLGGAAPHRLDELLDLFRAAAGRDLEDDLALLLAVFEPS